MRALAARGRDRLRLAFPPRAYAKHGTSVETGLLVIDRGQAAAPSPSRSSRRDPGRRRQAGRRAGAAADRPAAPVPHRVRSVAFLAPRARALATPVHPAGVPGGAAPVAYRDDAPGRARATTSASTRPTRSAASLSPKAGHTPPRSWNPGPWPRSRRRRRPIARSCRPRSRGDGPGVRRPDGDGDLCRRGAHRRPLPGSWIARRGAAPG